MYSIVEFILFVLLDSKLSEKFIDFTMVCVFFSAINYFYCRKIVPIERLQETFFFAFSSMNNFIFLFYPVVFVVIFEKPEINEYRNADKCILYRGVSNFIIKDLYFFQEKLSKSDKKPFLYKK